MPTIPRVPYRVRGVSSTPGTGNITVAAADSLLYRTFSSHYGTGSTVIGYILVGPATNKFFEIGVGSFNGTTNVLTRDADNKILASSNAGARVNIPAGVTFDVLAMDAGSHYLRTFTSALVLDQMDHGGAFMFTGTTATNVTLAPLARVPVGGSYLLKNDGTANLTLNAASGESITRMSANFTIIPGDGVLLYRGSSTWHFIPFRQQSSVFYNNAGTVTNKYNFTIHRSPTAPTTGMTDGDLWIQV